MSSQTFQGAPATGHRPAASWRPDAFRSASGTEVATFEAGRSDPGAPVLVLVHGMGHWTQAAWDAVAADFEATHRIVAFDLPGFGASEEARGAYTLPFFTSVLREVIERMVPGRTVALAGHSLGGLIVAAYAARYGSTVRNLTLVDPAGFLRTPALALRVMGSGPVVGLMRSIKPSRRFVIGTLERAVFDPASISPDVKERAVELAADPAMTRAFFGVYAGAMHEMIHMRELHANLGAWRGPTLLVWGRQDRFIPFRALATAIEVYPNASVLAIDSCGHCPNVEYPELVAARMRANGA